jgi:hypothetical protein
LRVLTAEDTISSRIAMVADFAAMASLHRRIGDEEEVVSAWGLPGNGGRFGPRQLNDGCRLQIESPAKIHRVTCSREDQDPPRHDPLKELSSQSRTQFAFVYFLPKQHILFCPLHRQVKLRPTRYRTICRKPPQIVPSPDESTYLELLTYIHHHISILQQKLAHHVPRHGSVECPQAERGTSQLNFTSHHASEEAIVAFPPVWLSLTSPAQLHF